MRAPVSPDETSAGRVTMAWEQRKNVDRSVYADKSGYGQAQDTRQVTPQLESEALRSVLGFCG